ncbi:hypothetical protein POPTR_006G097901v4 [Populus trichocarpa]|uniref:Aquaporin n=1 Tax=Populus trichocarpa TaxID=3694 RepID=A0A3N7F247_POPTR|nr:hypothetical protein POPTR_006G097901v4 [Populus trichocarpa]
MEGREEDARVGQNRYRERQPIGTAAQTQDVRDYTEPPPAPLLEPGELSLWSFYRAGIAEFVATFLFLYITVLTSNCNGGGKIPHQVSHGWNSGHCLVFWWDDFCSCLSHCWHFRKTFTGRRLIMLFARRV